MKTWLTKIKYMSSTEVEWRLIIEFDSDDSPKNRDVLIKIGTSEIHCSPAVNHQSTTHPRRVAYVPNGADLPYVTSVGTGESTWPCCAGMYVTLPNAEIQIQ